jgi:hypothetical protein
MTKLCSHCNQDLPLDSFQPRSDRKDKLRSHCRACCKSINASWRTRNKELLVLKRKENYLKSATEYRTYSQEWRRRFPLKKLIHGAMERARKHSLPFDITADDLTMPEFCPVLGIKLEPNVGGKKSSDNSPSLDRVIPSLGYVKGNVCIISNRANMIKNCGTLEEHQKIVNYLRSHGGRSS